MSLEEALQAFVNAIEGERNALWEAGDIIRAWPDAVRSFASAGKCTVTRCRQLADVASAFEVGLRDRERSHTWHRAVRAAALRNQRSIPEVLKEAQENDYGQRELDALGRNRSFSSWAGECGDCGARVTVKMVTEMKGTELQCPNGECGLPLGRLM